MSGIELKPCPFCGGQATLTDTMPAGQFWCYCEECNAEGSGYDTASDAISAWNRRAEDRQEPTDYSNLLSVITDIRERSGVGSKPMLSELADAIAERIAEPKVGDEIQFCPQCGWNSAMDATPEPLPAGTVTEEFRSKFQLWFFRDMTDDQRRKLFGIFGMPVDDLSTHGAQQIALRHILEAAFAARPAAHDLYKTGDIDALDVIKDRNGEVVLGLCRRCGRGEIELEQPCVSSRPAAEPVAVKVVPSEDEFMEWLDRAYNHPGNDKRNFTRWNMQVAFSAGIEWAANRSALVSAPAPGLVEALRKIFTEHPEPEFDWSDTDGARRQRHVEHHQRWGERIALEVQRALASITETGEAK